MLDHACQIGRHPLIEHPHDCYDTPAAAVHALIRVERLPPRIWEPACGRGNIVNVLRAAGHTVIATDLQARGCGRASVDFLECRARACDAIVTNPPYSLAEAFVTAAIERAPLVIMLLRLAFLESKRRAQLLDTGRLARIHVFSRRLPMMHRAGWKGRKASSAIPFAWFVWQRAHRGPATIDRIDWRDS